MNTTTRPGGHNHRRTPHKSGAGAPSASADAGPVLGSICTGYGGLDIGVLAASGGGHLAWCADPDPAITKILAARMPGVPNLGDIRALDWTTVDAIDVLVAGFPCQDISSAGKRAGIEKGQRSALWTEIMAGIRCLRPPLVVLENVAALRWKTGGLHRVLGDLAEARYDALWRSVRASDIGAPHRRERVFILAWDRTEPYSPANTDGTRRLIQRSQRTQQTGRPVLTGPTAYPADTDSRRRSLSGDPDGAQPWAPRARRLHHADRRCPAAAHSIEDQTSASGDATVDTADANTQSQRRGEGVPGAAGFQRRSDALVCGAAAAAHTDPSRRHRGAPQPNRRPTGPAAAAGDRDPHVDWGPYRLAIARWENILGRPAPHPTELGRHGRPVLSARFVEFLMGLSAGWVSDIDLPRTAKLRALGNGVVPLQAATALTLLLADLDALHTMTSGNHTAPEAEAA